MHAIKPQTGEKAWSLPLSKRAINTGVVVKDNTVFMSHGDENLDTAELGLIAAIDGVPRSEGRVDLEAVALDVVGALSPTFAETGRTLTLSSDHDAVIAGDAAQIGAVLVNLLENVLRHAGPGAAASVLVRRGRAGVSLTVRDTGPGVPAEEASRIFDRFVRLDRSRSTPGHGLGLSLVRSVATAHDAAISVETEAGGFAVTLTFPACRHG